MGVIQKFQNFFQRSRFGNSETYEASGKIVFIISPCFQREIDLPSLKEAILEVDEEHCLSLEDFSDERGDGKTSSSLLVYEGTTDILNKKACWFRIIFSGSLNQKQTEKCWDYLYHLAEELAKKELWYVEEVSALVEINSSISFYSHVYWGEFDKKTG